MLTGFPLLKQGMYKQGNNTLQFGIGSREYGTRRLVCEMEDREIAVRFLATVQILHLSLGLEHLQVPPSLYSKFARGMVRFEEVLACNFPPKTHTLLNSVSQSLYLLYVSPTLIPKRSALSPHSVMMCFTRYSMLTAIISVSSINHLTGVYKSFPPSYRDNKFCSMTTNILGALPLNMISDLKPTTVR